MNQIIHCPDRLLDRRIRISTMTEEQIEIGYLQSSKGISARFIHMLPRQSLVVGSVSTPEDLAGDDDTLSAPAQTLERVPHHNLGIAMSISFGIIEEVHPSIVGGRHTLDCNLLTHLPTISHPGTQREFAQSESGTPQLTIVHSSTSLHH